MLRKRSSSSKSSKIKRLSRRFESFVLGPVPGNSNGSSTATPPQQQSPLSSSSSGPAGLASHSSSSPPSSPITNPTIRAPKTGQVVRARSRSRSTSTRPASSSAASPLSSSTSPVTRSSSVVTASSMVGNSKRRANSFAAGEQQRISSLRSVPEDEGGEQAWKDRHGTASGVAFGGGNKTPPSPVANCTTPPQPPSPTQPHRTNVPSKESTSKEGWLHVYDGSTWLKRWVQVIARTIYYSAIRAPPGAFHVSVDLENDVSGVEEDTSPPAAPGTALSTSDPMMLRLRLSHVHKRTSSPRHHVAEPPTAGSSVPHRLTGKGTGSSGSGASGKFGSLRRRQRGSLSHLEWASITSTKNSETNLMRERGELLLRFPDEPTRKEWFSFLGECVGAKRQAEDFFNAVTDGSLDVIDKMLSDHEDVSGGRAVQTTFSVHLENEYGETPLHVAAEAGRHEVVELLIARYGACLDTRDEAQCTPLHCSARSGQLSATQVLIDKEASVDLRTARGCTAVHLMMNAPCVEPFRFEEVFLSLLRRGTDINARNVMGETALHISAQNGRSLSVALCLQNGADPEAITKLGYTALQLSAREGHGRCVSTLLNHGVSVYATCVDGTSRDVAMRAGHHHVVELLDHHQSSSTGYPNHYQPSGPNDINPNSGESHLYTMDGDTSGSFDMSPRVLHPEGTIAGRNSLISSSPLSTLSSSAASISTSEATVRPGRQPLQLLRNSTPIPRLKGGSVAPVYDDGGVAVGVEPMLDENQLGNSNPFW
eukprot:TRINITY_DN6516_c0_g1_i2.p1 TRINITY_DN6516_c0_g1~~TRINITY_DN6516_c0_g1_i2.p1  ORF type:complete len:766 (+),score=111.55 TRINITY_DN6516_c0_g1_i2:315-2612(+)